MNTKAILITAGISLVSSAITALIAARLARRAEREKWNREFTLKYADAVVTDKRRAESMAAQFAIGFVIYETPNTLERQKYFIPTNTILFVGRDDLCDIAIQEPMMSRQHFQFASDQTNVYVVDLNTANGTYLNGARIKDRCQIKSGDVVEVGKSKLSFYRLA